MEVINHLERYLGEIKEGIRLDDRQFHISMSIFCNTPFDDVNSYASLGLSSFLLSKGVRLELIFTAGKEFDSRKVALFFLAFCEGIAKSGISPNQGTVYDFGDAIYPECKMRKIYVTTPVFYEEDIQILQYDSTKVIFPWIFPIYESEALYIEQNGHDEFESYLEEAEIDNFWDLYRSSWL